MIANSSLKLNKSKFILTIAFTILGGALMLESMISGIFHFTGNLYEDFKVFGLGLQAPQAPIKTSFFYAQEGQILSVWLRFSSRRIENQNLKIAVSLIDEDENRVWEFWKDFRFDHFRNSAGKVKYFKLGDNAFKKEFRGYLQYELNGTWTPATTSALVLRISQPVPLPLKQIGFFVVGLFVLIVGLEAISQARSL